MLVTSQSQASYYSKPRRGGNVPSKEVPEVDKLAVLLVLDINHSPAGLASADGLSVNDDAALGTDDSERNHVLDITINHTSKHQLFTLTRIVSLS